MDSQPIICFGQQPNGFFPKRFFYAKVRSARNLQKEIGGKIVFFYHDSDADYRETITIMNDKTTGQEVRLNFTQENKIQKNFSPLYLKRIPTLSPALPHQDHPIPAKQKNGGPRSGGGGQGGGWKDDILKQLPRFVGPDMIELFTSVNATNDADFCLEMYKRLGLLDGIEVLRSSDKNFRQTATDLSGEFYADVAYENEIVRARVVPAPSDNSNLITSAKGGSASGGYNYLAQLHHGGGKTTQFEIPGPIQKSLRTPGRDERFAWMNSVIHSTHYITGNSEFDYLKREEFPRVKFIKREQIEEPELAWFP